MSGLETLAALGLACNVFQVISFANEVCRIGKAIWEKGETADSAASFANSMSNLTGIFQDIERPASGSSPPASQSDTRMLEIAKDCRKAALQLKAEIDKYSGAASSAKGSRFKSTWVAVKSVVRSRDKLVDRLEKRLQTHQNTLETELLVKVCSKADAAKLCQEDEFKKLESLDTTLRDFVKRFSEGETRMKMLLAQQSESVKVHVTKETAAVKVHVTEETATLTAAMNDFAMDSKKAVEELDGTMRDSSLRADMEKKRERLIKSLKYPTMNGRRNQIVDPHTETFEWIFTKTPMHDVWEYDTWRHRSLASDRFFAWLRDPVQLLFWITGKPGSGKSTLVKFLANDPRTRDGLNSCECGNQDFVILSHFIWIAGQTMESSVKGMLCNLVHQVLSKNYSICDRLLEEFPDTTSKDYCSDWSERELQNALSFLLGHSSKMFCFFIDGLDEISTTDGQIKLIELLEDIRALSNVKMCVSSRQELIFKNHFSRFPTVRMQDLTQADIFKFTSSLLQRRLLNNSIDLSTAEVRDLVSEVCMRAEGVFLWVVLAVRNLLLGIEQGDGIEELYRRLQLMPSELQDLYRTLWNRLGTEKEIYQREAATYFNFVMLYDDTNWLNIASFWRHNSVPSTPLTLLLATDNNLSDRAVFGPLTDLPFHDELRALTNKMAHRVEARSLGLLDIKTWDNYPSTMRLNFIHRSAKEFLETDTEGRALLELDVLTKQERLFRILMADLAQRTLVDFGSYWLDQVLSFHGTETGRSGAKCFISVIQNLRNFDYISETQAIQLSLSARSLFFPYRRLYAVSGLWQHHFFPDLLGAAAIAGEFNFLKQAMRARSCRGVTTGTFSVPYMSYLVTMALQCETLTGSMFEKASNTVHWLLKHNVDPNFPTQSHPDFNDLVISTSPLKAAVRLLWDQEFLPNNFAEVVNILSILVQAGGDVSSPLILVLEKSRNASTDRPTVRLRTLKSVWQCVGVYVEVETALVIDLLVRKYLGHPTVHAASVKKLLSILESYPMSELAVRRVTAPQSFSSMDFHIFNSLYKTFKDNVSFWTTSDPACLSRIQEHLMTDLELKDSSVNLDLSNHENDSDISTEASSTCEDDSYNSMEVSTSWLCDMVKEVEEAGKAITWDDVYADWVSKDMLWDENDPRRKIPEAWTS